MRFKRIYIEITNVCNLSCTFCPPSTRVPRYMTFDEFKIVLEKIKPYTEYIYLHVKGEPTLHPDFETFVKLAYEEGFNINLTTNGTLLKNHLNITKYLRQINISLHATNSEEIIKTAKNIDNTIINFRIWNKNENKDAVKLLEKEFNTKIPEKPNFTLADNKFLSQRNLFEWPNMENMELNETGYCYGLNTQLAILVDGTVVPCCLDNNGDINLGNIYMSNIDEIINSQKALDIINGFRKRVAVEELCKKCTYKDSRIS